MLRSFILPLKISSVLQSIFQNISIVFIFHSRPRSRATMPAANMYAVLP